MTLRIGTVVLYTTCKGCYAVLKKEVMPEAGAASGPPFNRQRWLGAGREANVCLRNKGEPRGIPVSGMPVAVRSDRAGLWMCNQRGCLSKESSFYPAQARCCGGKMARSGHGARWPEACRQGAGGLNPGLPLDMGNRWNTLRAWAVVPAPEPLPAQERNAEQTVTASFSAVENKFGKREK